MAFDAFLKIEGIPGESKDAKHSDWIEVLQFDWGVDQPSSSSASSLGSLSAERATFQPFSIVKGIDKSSPKLAIGCADGTHYSMMTLEICRAGGDKQPYMEYKLTDVMVTSFRPNGTARIQAANGNGTGTGNGNANGEPDIPTESIKFQYGKIELKYIQTQVAGGQGGGSVAAGWDLKTNKKV